ncbi:MAG: hypothetical protein M4579_006435 [Chaenotheca gracillima]|nr:MAG: hypothetical protein M4579_006435 [Chaenotheca gracillima]
MSTVTSSQPPNSTTTTTTTTKFDYLTDEHMNDSPSSRFTAVNGRELSASGGATNGDAAATEPPKADTKESLELPPPRIHDAGRRDPQPEPVEKLRLSTENGDWPHAPTNGDISQSNSSTSHQSNFSNMQRSDSSRQSPQKRKRTESPDRRPSISTTYTSHGPSRSPPRPSVTQDVGFLPEASENTRRAGSHSPPRRGSYTATQPRYGAPGQEDREHSMPTASYYGQPSQSTRQPYEPPRSTTPTHGSHSEMQLAEALQRESENMDAASRQRLGTSPEDDDSHGHLGSGDFDPNQTPNSSVQVDHRRRKRVFSNRTKTGCMTCRRRKKKCDEQKPECNNCIRGGFVCEGYSNRIEWQKTTRDKPPIPLQAKEGEQASGQYVQTAMGTSPTVMGQNLPRDQSPSSYRGTLAGQPPISSGGTRPLLGDDERERPAVSSPPGKHQNLPAWQKPWPTQATNPPHQPSDPKTDFVRVPPISELPRPIETDPSSASQSTSAVSHRSLLHPAQPTSPQTPQQAQAQTQAQLALQQTASLRRPSTEKDKMLAGDLYFPFANELVYERERCKAAIWRFNNSMNPNSGISREERARLFRDIVQPKEPQPPSRSPSPVGRVGENVVVEAPFNCDYGYNITIGADVLIGTNCTIMDTCSVTIGPRTVIGPNVNLLTATMPIDPRRRKGSLGPSLGRSIVIEEDCWIGAGVIIL